MSLSKEHYAYIAGAAAVTAAAYYLISARGDKPAQTPEDLQNAVIDFFADPAAKENKWVTKQEIFKRSNMISNVTYKIAYALLRGGKDFHGKVEIKFNLTAEGAESDDVFCDYRGEKILSMSVNGNDVKDGNPFRDHRVYFPKAHLKEGDNSVQIRFISNYVRDCQGMHYYVDKDDNEEYIYSQFETVDAHKAFPCFD